MVINFQMASPTLATDLTIMKDTILDDSIIWCDADPEFRITTGTLVFHTKETPIYRKSFDESQFLKVINTNSFGYVFEHVSFSL